ncbi:hypothetical protein BHM03_00054590, partial [Ensete ventricosum]
VPEPPRSIRSAPTPFKFPSPHARSDNLLHHSGSRAPTLDQISSYTIQVPDRSDHLLHHSGSRAPTLGQSSSYTIQVPEPPRSVGSTPTPFEFLSPHARSDQLLHHSGSRAPTLGQISSYTIQVPEPPCSVGSAPAPFKFSSPHARSDQLLHHSSSRAPTLSRINSCTIQIPEPSRSVHEPPRSVGSALTPFKFSSSHSMLTWPPHHRALGQLARRRGRPDVGSRSDASMGGVSGRTADLTQVRSTLLTCRRTPHSKHQGHGGKVRRHDKS